MLTLIDLICCCLDIYITKYYFKYLFFAQLCFYELSKLFLDLLDRSVNPHTVFFLLEKTFAMLE